MAPPTIVAKLQTLLAKGIANEAEALYFLVEVRKLLEQQGAKKQYEYLTFHCDWAVHPTLAGTTAQKILKNFDEANIHLKTGVELHDLPSFLKLEIDGISQMEYFEAQLSTFLKANGLPTLRTTRSDGWTHFLHLYAKIVEDCPLVMASQNHSATVASVTLKMELANLQPVEGHAFFKVSWIVADKNGLSGVIDIFHSFSLSPHES